MGIETGVTGGPGLLFGHGPDDHERCFAVMELKVVQEERYGKALFRLGMLHGTIRFAGFASSLRRGADA